MCYNEAWIPHQLLRLLFIVNLFLFTFICDHFHQLKSFFKVMTIVLVQRIVPSYAKVLVFVVKSINFRLLLLWTFLLLFFVVFWNVVTKENVEVFLNMFEDIFLLGFSEIC